MPELPSGTVTFLFTDIEGSTVRWEHQPEMMRAALARHDALVRAAIEEHGGHVVKTMGDAFHAVFARAPDGLAAALDAQRRLQAEAWGEIGPIRVRMALHTGAAEERGGDYYGPPLNRAARLMSAGHGGQVLLSQTTYDLVRDELPERAHLIELGEHRLKDLGRPEHVHQLAAPDLPVGFPPLRSLDARPHNLPIQPTPLLGREHELAAVRTLLLRDDVRLVTLTGPGGTGKTRLAVQVASDMLDHFEDGAFLVELAPISDPVLVVSTVARAVGVHDVAGRPLLDALLDALRERQLLLALDNFEQVLPAASAVSELLRTCPRLAILVTSREPLQIRGEHEFPVPPLAIPSAEHSAAPEILIRYPSVALFVERATAVRPDFAVTSQNGSAVAEICRRLDGLPLAIELAATRVRLLTPQAIRARLEHRLSLLTGGSRDSPTRQQTLRGAIGWSYDLLDEMERALFRRLATSVGGFTLESAEAIGNPDGGLGLDMLDGISSLVAKSLVRQQERAESEPRFVMLETIREYGLEQAEASGEAGEMRRRHAEHFTALAEQAAPRLWMADGGAWLDRLQVEHDNLRAALAWGSESAEAVGLPVRLAGSLWRFWWARGHFAEGRRWLDRALGRSTDPHARLQALLGAGWLAFYQDDYARARQHWDEMLVLGRTGGDRRAVAWALGRLGFLAARTGDYDRAVALCDEGLALSRHLGDEETLVHALVARGHAAFGLGDNDRAVACWEEALRRARAIGHAHAQSHALYLLARAVSVRGDLDRAAALSDEALAMIRQRGDGWGELMACDAAIRVAQLRADEGRVAELGRASLVRYHEVRSQRGIATMLMRLAWVARARRQPARACRLLGASQALAEATGTHRSRADEDAYEMEVATLSESLAKVAFAAAWAEGRAMTLEQAGAYALEEQPSA